MIYHATFHICTNCNKKINFKIFRYFKVDNIAPKSFLYLKTNLQHFFVNLCKI